MSTAVSLLHTTAYKTVSYQDYQPIAVLTVKIQYTAFLCAVQISITSINKASEGIVQKKGREKKDCPVSTELYSVSFCRSLRRLMFAPCCHSQHIS